MMRAKLFLGLIPVLGVQLLLAQVPQAISYQGVLTDAAGDPVDGNKNLRFTLYSDEGGLDQLWTEEHTDFNTQPVVVAKGIFNVRLGLHTSLVGAGLDFSTPYWLEISVYEAGIGWIDLSPLVELQTAPYAFRASTAANADAVLGPTTGDNYFPSSGNVGIGTTTPPNALHVVGTAYATTVNVGGTLTAVDIGATGTVTATAFVGNGSGLTGLELAPGAVGTAELADNAVTSAKLATAAVTGPKIATGVIDGSHISTSADLQVNQLGVGVAPIRPLDIEGTTTGDYVASIRNTAVGVNAGNGLLVSVADTAVGGGTILSVEGQGNSYLTVTDRGKVGIGTTTPAYQLHVRDTTTNSDYLAYFNHQPTSSAAYGIYANANAYNAGANWAYGGKIQATGGSSGGGAYGLQVYADSYGASMAYGIKAATSGSGTGTQYAIHARASGGTGAKYAFYGAGGNFYMNGNMGLGTTVYLGPYRLAVFGIAGGTYTWVVLSDKRYKDQVETLPNALDNLSKIRGVSFKWNELTEAHGHEAGETDIGVIAQEIEQVFPELVVTNDDGYKAVGYAKLTPILIEAVKELRAQKDALEKQVAAQQGEITQLQQQMARVETLLASVDLASRE